MGVAHFWSPPLEGKTVILKMDFVASVFTLRFKVLRCGSYICLLRNSSFPSRKEAAQSVLYYLVYDYSFPACG